MVGMKDSGVLKKSKQGKKMEMMETVKIKLRKMTASMQFPLKNSKANLS